MNSSQSVNIFCPKHSDCLAPISVIADILSENDPLKLEQVSIQFDQLGFTKVQDLANATLGKASSIKLWEDSLTLLYKAIEIYSERLDNLVETARLECRNRNFVKTQKICIDILKQKPAHFDVLILIAETLYNSKNYDTCIDYLKIAKSINKNCCEINMNLGLAHWKKNEIDDAKLFISTACILKPKRINNWIIYADFLFQTNNLVLAQLLYEFILRVDSKLFYVHTKYGKTLYCTNRIKDAKRHFKIALNIAPEFQDALNNLGDLYFMINKFDKAILLYLKVLKNNSDDKTTIFNLGMSYFKKTEHQKAIEAFEKAINLDPEYFTALKMLSITYCHSGNMELSIETFKKCLLLQPDNFEVNLELAMINFNKLNNLQEAEHYFEKCIELNSERKDLYKNLFSVYQKLKKHTKASDICIPLGDLYMKDEDYENARNAYNCCIYINPENALGHWKVGLALYNLGHKDVALIRYKKAIYLKPTFSKAYIDCGVIFEENGDHKMALEYYQTAIQLQPDDVNALENMTNLQQKMSQIVEDMKALEINIESAETKEQIEQ